MKQKGKTMKKRLTFDEHKELGPRIKALDKEINDLWKLLTPRSSSMGSVSRKITILKKTMLDLRSVLDNEVCRISTDPGATKIYFGND